MTISAIAPTYITDLASPLKPMAPGFEGTYIKSGPAKYLVSSPYPGLTHHLDLNSVDEISKQLSIALQHFRSITDDYPSQPYAESFNWQEVVDLLPSDFSGVPIYSNSF